MICCKCSSTEQKRFNIEHSLCRKCYRKLPNILSKEKEVASKYRTLNRDNILTNQKEYYQVNLELERARRKSYEKARIANDFIFKTKKNLRTRIKNAIKRQNKFVKFTINATQYVINIKEIIVHLESQFKPGMSWDNYGDWEIDHIRPLGSFDLSNPQELRVACHHTNLQPIWHKDHIAKTISDIKYIKSLGEP